MMANQRHLDQPVRIMTMVRPMPLSNALCAVIYALIVIDFCIYTEKLVIINVKYVLFNVLKNYLCTQFILGMQGRRRSH